MNDINDLLYLDNIYVSDLKSHINECIYLYINENISLMSKESFHKDMYEDLYQYLINCYINVMDKYLDLIIKYYITKYQNIYFSSVIPQRSYETTFIRKHKPNKYKLTSKINYLKDIYQPEQRTDDWYVFRHNLITASSAWKGLDSSEKIVNSLIYEKCQPLNLTKYSNVNIYSPFHHGTIYEPISVQIYERDYCTKVEDFGCIKNPKYDYLGASPDGINIDETSERYGRMLEIKNIVNREITGIPKKEYWIQMQMQMGVCELNECDFLETKFTEYEDYDDYKNDGEYFLSSDNKLKGIFLCFLKKDRPYYEYPDINLSKNEFKKWETEIMDKNKDLTWIKNIYWKLDIISCVLVLRNKLWFDDAIKKLANISEIIKKEKNTGYDHRKPQKRPTKIMPMTVKTDDIKGTCIIDLKGFT